MNLRPPGYEPDELPSCSTPRHSVAFIGDIDYYTLFQQFCQEGAESFFAAEAEDENAAADLLSRKPAATPIHAPPRGATLCLPALPSITAYFNSRPSARGDLSVGDASQGYDANFNSRPSARGDSSVHGLHKVHDNFNSRPSARGDAVHQQYARTICISIHAPPRGATEKQIKFAADLRFQFTPLREGRPVRW